MEYILAQRIDELYLANGNEKYAYTICSEELYTKSMHNEIILQRGLKKVRDYHQCSTVIPD